MDSYVVKTKRKAQSPNKKSSDFTKKIKHGHQTLQENPPKELKNETACATNNVTDDEDMKKQSTSIQGAKEESKTDSICIKGPDLKYLSVKGEPPKWRQIRGENLNCDYCVLLKRSEADELFRTCEETLTYNSGRMAQVQIFGKWLDIPRKQVAFGDPGLSYNFSGNNVPARPWIPFLEDLRNYISKLSGHHFNFVLINRYENGNDHMGEHRDDEKDLVRTSPIASLSLGQARDFIFKHADSRGKNATRQIPTVKVELENGSLLMMNHPTNTHWYHSLPKRKNILGVRINMTFRDFVVRK